MIILGFSPLLTAWKLEIKKKRKKHLDISPFYTSVPKLTIICYTVPCSWDMVRDRCNCYFSFWASFCLLTPPPPAPTLTVQNMKMSKKLKKKQEISSFYIPVPKIMIICYTVPEKWHMTHVIDGWTDRQTDGQKKWYIEVGAPPENLKNWKLPLILVFWLIKQH